MLRDKRVLIVGSGISGITIAALLKATNPEQDLTIIEEKNHIGGNLYDYERDGMIIQKYGPHVIHTENKRVWDFFVDHTEMYRYQHKVVGSVDGQYISMPMNLTGLKCVLSDYLYNQFEEHMHMYYTYDTEISLYDLIHHENDIIKVVATHIYENILLNYTLKQWSLPPEKVDRKLLQCAKFRFNKDSRYYDEPYQGVPLYGYTKMFEKICNTYKLNVQLNTPFKYSILNNYDLIFYTGSIENPELHGCHKFNSLPYVGVNVSVYQQHNKLPAAVVNYPNMYNFTRMTDYSYFNRDWDKDYTYISVEYPYECKDSKFYPVNNKYNQRIYREIKHQLPANVIPCGRLGNYKYMTISQTVEEAFNLVQKYQK